MPEVVPPDAVFAVHHANALTGETPYWDEERSLVWWIDIQGQRLLGYAPGSGETIDCALPSMPGFVTGRRNGGLLLGLEDGIYPFDLAKGLGECIASVEADDSRTRINDGRADAAGRLWFSTMDKTGSGAPIGALYRMDPDLRIHKIRSEIRVPNSIEFAPDGCRMYFADSRSQIVEAIAYDPMSGSMGHSVEFVRFSGHHVPDGCCVDSGGNVWIAVIGGGRIECRQPDGSLAATIYLPVSRPTMPTLGGRDGRTMYITSQRRFLSAERLPAEPLAGDLLAVRVATAARKPFLAGV